MPTTTVSSKTAPTVLSELLEEAVSLLEGHLHSAYCQACDQDEERLVERIKATPEYQTIVQEKQAARANLLQPKCPKCLKPFENAVDVRNHRRAKGH